MGNLSPGKHPLTYFFSFGQIKEDYLPLSFFIFDNIPTSLFPLGLKSHAVTMFEVGKLSDESLDSLLVELGKVERQVSLAELVIIAFSDHLMLS